MMKETGINYLEYSNLPAKFSDVLIVGERQTGFFFSYDKDRTTYIVELDQLAQQTSCIRKLNDATKVDATLSKATWFCHLKNVTLEDARDKLHSESRKYVPSALLAAVLNASVSPRVCLDGMGRAKENWSQEGGAIARCLLLSGRLGNQQGVKRAKNICEESGNAYPEFLPLLKEAESLYPSVERVAAIFKANVSDEAPKATSSFLIGKGVVVAAAYSLASNDFGQLDHKIAEINGNQAISAAYPEVRRYLDVFSRALRGKTLSHEVKHSSPPTLEIK